MNFEDQMEAIERDCSAAWVKYQNLLNSRQELVDKHLGECKFCGGEVQVCYDHYREQWSIHCEECSASTPPAKTYGQSAKYWKAMVDAKEE